MIINSDAYTPANFSTFAAILISISLELLMNKLGIRQIATSKVVKVLKSSHIVLDHAYNKLSADGKVELAGRKIYSSLLHYCIHYYEATFYTSLALADCFGPLGKVVMGLANVILPT